MFAPVTLSSLKRWCLGLLCLNLRNGRSRSVCFHTKHVSSPSVPDRSHTYKWFNHQFAYTLASSGILETTNLNHASHLSVSTRSAKAIELSAQSLIKCKLNIHKRVQGLTTDGSIIYLERKPSRQVEALIRTGATDFFLLEKSQRVNVHARDLLGLNLHVCVCYGFFFFLVHVCASACTFT